MKGKKLLAAFLLGAGLCFVPVLGYGEVNQGMVEEKAWYIELLLLQASVKYVMSNPTNFLFVLFTYSPPEVRGGFPKGVDIKGKIWVRIVDNRGMFYSKSGIVLREQFKKILEGLYTYIDDIATDMDTDIVALFVSKGDIRLGYFYEGEYHLWGE